MADTKKHFWHSRDGLFAALYIALVGAILLIPALLTKTQSTLFVENRQAAAFPEISRKNYRNIAPQFEKYLADRFGLRKCYVIAWNALRLYGFHECHEQIVLGKDGLVFLASHFAGEEHRNDLFHFLLDCDEAAIQQNVQALLLYKALFQASKKPLLLVTVPTKHSLDFDRVPDEIRRSIVNNPEGVPVFTKITEKLTQTDPDHAGKYFLDLYGVASAANRTIRLIPRKNFHWIPGPYTHLAAHEIARRFGVVKGEITLREADYPVRHTKSDLNHFLVLNPRNDALVAPCPVPRIPLRRKFPALDAPKEFNKLEFFAENPQAPGGKILVIGDSFTNPLCQDLARYFSQVVTMEISAMQRFSPPLAHAHILEVARLYDPDCIVCLSHCGYIHLDIVAELAK